MTKDAISDYSATAGSNTDVGGVNIDEGCPPSGINNAIRELMSHLADLNAGTTSLSTIKVDNLQLNGNAITSTNTDGNITLTPNGNGLVSIAEGDLQIGSTTVTATGAELNLMDGGTSPGTTAVAGSDGIVTNDNSTMRQTTVDTFDTYLSQTTKTLTNKSISGASNTITAVPLTALDIDGGTATTTLADADLLIVDDGAGGTNRKITAANAKTYFGGGGTSAPTALSGTSTAIDWSANSQFTHTLSGATTYTFSNISAGASIELYLKNVGKRFDLLNQTKTNVSFSSQLGTSDDVFASFFNNDGSKFYIVEGSTTIIYEYNLSTNYDISTASFVQSKSGMPSASQSGYQFNSDGTKLISIRGDDLHEHVLTSAYNISTINTTAANSVNLDTVLGDSGGSGLLFDNGRFNSDGTKLFISNERHSNSDSNAFEKSHFVITLSSAYDITSTLALESSFDVGYDLTVFGRNYDGFIASDISADGQHMVVVEQTITSSRRIHSYFLQTPFDLSTIKRVGSDDYERKDADSEVINFIRIHPDGENYHVHEKDNSASSDNQALTVVDIQGNHAVTFPTVTSSQPQTFGDGGDPTTVSFLRLTSNDGTNVLITDHREIS
tara:strand:+ start:4382 stop:6217 length:1836 start_codon:yes stop_codon:yes gene_type:complete